MNDRDEETPVSASRHQRAGELFLNALELPPAERSRFLADACADDTALLEEVTSLLNAHDTADHFLTTPIVDAALVPRDEETQVLECSAPLAPGVTVDRKYRIDRLLGKGGMGAVYLATHVGTTRTVAVKVINPEYAVIDEFIARFRREAAAAGRLRHPNIVNVTDFGVADVGGTKLPYLAMEYLDGHTLGDHLKQHGRMPLDRVLDVVDQVALALDSAHAAGIVHRDLKPDNIWLESNRRGGYNVKVLDFGIAKSVSGEQEDYQGNVNSTSASDSAAELQSGATITIYRVPDQPGETGDLKTRLGAIVGTPAYMSPEQCRGIPVDYRADIYSLAVITYELVAGNPPFQGATVAELLSQQIEAPVPSPRKFDAEISKPIAAAIMRGLEKNPADRPVSAGTLAALLRGVVEGEFSVLRKGKDTFQSYPSVFAPLWIAAFAPMVPFGVAAVLVLFQVAKANIVPHRWLIIGFYVVAIGAWIFCAQMYKAAAALMLQKVASVGAFRPATAAVIGRLIRGLPELLYTHIASLLDVRPASVWQNQLWPVVWALEGLRGKAALKRSQQLTRAVPDIGLTLLPRCYAPPLCAALTFPAVFAFFPDADFIQLFLTRGGVSWPSLFYLVIASRLYVLYGTAFPFYFWFAGLCRGEFNIPILPGSAGRERSGPAKLRSSTLIWWLIPAAFVFASLIALVRKPPVDFGDAVAEGHGSKVLHAIDAGQAVDATKIAGESAFYIASRHGDVRLMRALLDRGANIDKQQRGGKTALMEAVRYHQAAAARLLVSRGANVNLQSTAGRTALMTAAVNGDVEIAALLINHKANLKLQDATGKSALDYALEEHHPEIAALLSR